MPEPERLFNLYQLPDSLERFKADWDVVYLPQGIKDLLLDYAQTLHRLQDVRSTGLALRRTILLFGPPGCGKTSLAMGLPAMWCLRTRQRKVGFIHVNTHALFSGVRGKGQENVIETFRKIDEQASTGYPIFVLIDEVETLGTDRSSINLEANPLDALLQVTAFFESLDKLARDRPNVIFIFTTNIPKAIDRAVRERADFTVEIPLPGQEHRALILLDAIHSLRGAYGVDELLFMAKSEPANPQWTRLLEQTHGMSGRTLRHLLVLAATKGVRSHDLSINHVYDALSLVQQVEKDLLDSEGSYIEGYQQPAKGHAQIPAGQR